MTAVNHVVIGGETKFDLRNDTVTPSNLAKGVTAHDASGNAITGELEPVKSVNNAFPDDNGNVTINDYVSNIEISGKNVTVTFADESTKTFATQDTTYSAATTSAAGLMSAEDKTKLNGLSSGGSEACYGTCSTATKTAAKVATISSGTFSLTAGMIVAIKFSNAVTSSSYGSSSALTLNVNSSGAKNIIGNDGSKITLWHSLPAGTYFFGYDGTQWKILDNPKIGYTDWNNVGT